MMMKALLPLLVVPSFLLAGCGEGDKPPTKPKPAPIETDQPAKPTPPVKPDAPDKTTPPIKPAKVDPPVKSTKPTSDKVSLKIELPKPLFVGTPKNLRVKNLEKPRTGRRPLIKVPKGVNLLSRGKPVTSSETDPWGDLEMVTDGDKNGVDDTFVELGFGKHWVQIDLEQTAPIHAVILWHYHLEGRVYHDVVVQLSTEPDFISPVTLFNNDDDNSAGLGVGKDKPYIETFEGKLIKVAGVKARYIRLYSKGNTSNDQNHYVEVEVFGKSKK